MENMSIPSFRVFTFALGFFLIGIFFSSFFGLDLYNIIWFLPIFLLMFFGIFLIIKKIYVLRLLLYLSLAFLSGFLLFDYKNSLILQNSPPTNFETEFSGVIVNYPEKNNSTQQFFVETEDFGKKKKILVTSKKFPEFNFGDKVDVKGVIKKPENFSKFDYVNYLKKFGVVSEVKYPEIKLISMHNGNKIVAKLFYVRTKFQNSVEKNLPMPESSLAIGLDIGSKEGFSKEIMDQFSKVGITHIVALSGYNVTIIIVFLTEILLGILTKKQIFIFSTILIILFDILAGGSSSIVRASIITLVITYGKTIGRRADMTNLLLLSASIMVAINPYLLRFDSGFALSFVAFAGLVYVSPIVKKILTFPFVNVIPDFIKTAITETMSAQIAVLPLLLVLFGRISLIAPISNILILPIVPATMLLVFVSALVDFALPKIGHLVYLISYFPLKYILFISEKFSKIPLSSVNIPTNLQIFFVALYSILIILAMIYVKRKWEDIKLI